MEFDTEENDDKNDSILKYLWNPLTQEESDSPMDQDIMFGDIEQKRG